MAFEAVAAIVTAASEASAAMAVVSEVGMAVSVVGAITGSKDMMKVGGVMSLAGGITSWVGSLGGDMSAIAAANAGAQEGAAGALSAPASAFSEVPTAAELAGGDEAAGIIGGAVADAQTASDAAYAAADYGASAAQGASLPDLAASATSAANGPTLDNAGAMNGAAPANGATTVDAPQQIGANAPTGPAEVQTPYSKGPEPTNSFMKKMTDLGQWMEKNKTLSGAIVQVGMGALNGMQMQYNLDRQYDLLAQHQTNENVVTKNKSTSSGLTRPAGNTIINAARGA